MGHIPQYLGHDLHAIRGLRAAVPGSPDAITTAPSGFANLGNALDNPKCRAFKSTAAQFRSSINWVVKHIPSTAFEPTHGNASCWQRVDSPPRPRMRICGRLTLSCESTRFVARLLTEAASGLNDGVFNPLTRPIYILVARRQ
jgi:hypothetical protein